MEIVENIALISINATLFAQLLSFLLFMWLFNRIMIRPLRRVMQDRVGYIDQIQQQIVAADKGLDDVAVQIRHQEDEVRQAMASLRKDIESAAQKSALAVMVETKQDIHDLKTQSQKQVNAKIADTRKQMIADADLLSDHIVGVILNSRSVL